MADHKYEGQEGKCKVCEGEFGDDQHCDHVLKDFESVLVKGPDGVVIWVTAVLGSSSVSVYENTDHNPTLSYDSHNHRRRQDELENVRRAARDWRSRASEGPRYAIDMD
jgi:hypothetical protein